MPDKQTTALLKSLDAQIRGSFEPLLKEKPMTTAELRKAVDVYMTRLVETASRVPSADPVAGKMAGEQCLDLLDASGTDDDENAHPLVQAAVRYYVTATDAQSDLSVGGFDDDLEVIARVKDTLDL